MRFLLIMLLMPPALYCCGSRPNKDNQLNHTDMDAPFAANWLTAEHHPKLAEFAWMNTPPDFELSDGMLRITAPPKCDFFINPVDGSVVASAPLYYREVHGDFVATALVRPDFSSVWNAAALMVHADSAHWIKLAFEHSDATGKSIVTVITRGNSDDANGAVLNDLERVWLRIIRKGDVYALHWSADGREYKMARLSALHPARTVRIGMEAQCPVGPAAQHTFLHFSIEQRTVQDLRKGE
jgi:uncharacterized protein